MHSLFKLRGTISSRQIWVLQLLGLALFFIVWLVLTYGPDPMVAKGILPGPWRVLDAYSDLYRDNELVKKTFRSLGLNLAGYIEAIAFAVPLGFIIGLFPFFKGMLNRYVDAIRFIPLTAVTQLFILWFGIGISMKVNFLAFGIFIYLLPVVVQRVREVESVYVKTVYTLGATDWQTIKTVFIPSVLSRLIGDIRVLTAISWTYIIVAEGIASQEGLGSMIFKVGQRQGRVDKVFAIILLITVIGAIQDKLFTKLDKELFPYKFQENGHDESSIESSLSSNILSYFSKTFMIIILALYVILALNEYTGLLTSVNLLSYLFGETLPAIHIIMLSIIIYEIRYWVKHRKK